MEDELTWCGPDVEPKTISQEGRELGALHEILENAAASLRDADGPCSTAADTLHAFDNLAAAYSMARPVFGIARSTLGRRSANAQMLGEIFARLTIAEINAIATIARARQRFLYRALKREPS